jgi:hypothetical protein
MVAVPSRRGMVSRGKSRSWAQAMGSRIVSFPSRSAFSSVSTLAGLADSVGAGRGIDHHRQVALAVPAPKPLDHLVRLVAVSLSVALRAPGQTATRARHPNTFSIPEMENVLGGARDPDRLPRARRDRDHRLGEARRPRFVLSPAEDAIGAGGNVDSASASARGE